LRRWGLCIAPPTFCSTGNLRTKSCHLTSPATPIVSKDTDVGRQRTAAPGRLPAAGKVTRLPHSELEGSGDHDDRADGDRYAARQRGLLHLDRRQRDAQLRAPSEEVFQRGGPLVGLESILLVDLNPRQWRRRRASSSLRRVSSFSASSNSSRAASHSLSVPVMCFVIALLSFRRMSFGVCVLPSALGDSLGSVSHDYSAGLGRLRLDEIEREPLVDAAEERLALA
jgi:hypothetical protein